ncbi:hypothetical protein ACLKA6_018249 [Drosophila palustris]
MAEGDTAEQDAENVIRIMVATDNHLGYAEKDAVRGEDSFTAFEEILEMAVAEDVDMILLGGDLFHDAQPSQNSMHKCIELLRRYTFGDKPVSLEILSDQAASFHNAVNQSVNYEDPNLNIAIPVFSIHGNHDDPSGFGRLSCLDLLSATGLVNYFGRWTDLTKVEISPILIRKGESKLGLYGLSHIHDARLARLFKEYQVMINAPNESDEEWFHLMVVHQNRAENRGPKNFIPEEALPSFMHLIIWGHEHDCRIDPELNVLRDFYVSQPGSSVATSLSEGEAKKKHVGLLEIYKTKFHLKPLPLQTVRPFVFDSINLEECVDKLNLGEGDASTKVYNFALERVEAMIKQAKTMLTGHPKQPTLPLIRLRLLFSEESHMFNTVRFGQMFLTRVANPADMVKFDKLKKFRGKSEKTSVDKEAMQRAMQVDNTTRVEQLVNSYFEQANNPLKLMHSKALAQITYRMVEHGDNDAAQDIYGFYSKKAIEHLMEALPDDDNIDEELGKFRLSHRVDDLLKEMDSSGFKEKASADENGTSLNIEPKSSMSSGEETTSRGAGETTVARGRGRGRGRGRAAANSATTRSTTSRSTSSPDRQQTLLSAVKSGRKTNPKTYVISDDDSD